MQCKSPGVSLMNQNKNRHANLKLTSLNGYVSVRSYIYSITQLCIPKLTTPPKTHIVNGLWLWLGMWWAGGVGCIRRGVWCTGGRRIRSSLGGRSVWWIVAWWHVSAFVDVVHVHTALRCCCRWLEAVFPRRAPQFAAVIFVYDQLLCAVYVDTYKLPLECDSKLNSTLVILLPEQQRALSQCAQLRYLEKC